MRKLAASWRWVRGLNKQAVENVTPGSQCTSQYISPSFRNIIFTSVDCSESRREQATLRFDLNGEISCFLFPGQPSPRGLRERSDRHQRQQQQIRKVHRTHVRQRRTDSRRLVFLLNMLMCSISRFDLFYFMLIL